jgi:hypothetical protein
LAVGIFQIRPICLKDLRDKYKVRYQIIHFKNVELSRWAFIAYGKMYGAETAEDYCRIWNGGPSGPRKKSTLSYWNDIKKDYE